MVLEPPLAEQELNDYDAGSHQEAGCVAAMSEEPEAPVVEKKASENRLGKIICQT